MMTNRHTITALALLLSTVGIGLYALPSSASGKRESTIAPVVQSGDIDIMRVQGEQRFRANCGRCHAAPQKFPPRMMKTVLRHMRVRATITDEDMRLVLFYMTQ
jgi:cytochrome c5